MRRLLRAAVLSLVLVVPALSQGRAAPLEGPLYASEIRLANGSRTVRLAGGIFGTGRDLHAGQYSLTVNQGTANDPSRHFSLLAWCVDVFHWVTMGPQTLRFDVVPLSTDGNGGVLSGAQAAAIGWLAAYGNDRLAQTGPNAAISAAVQAAIWNVEYGSRYAGSDKAIKAELDRIASLLPANLSGPAPLSLIGLPNARGELPQSLVTALFAPVPVPEPASAALLGAGLLGLWAVRRRRAAA